MPIDASRLSPNLSHRLAARKQAVASGRGIVVTQSRMASEAGAAVLRQGGNAVDAAIAAAFMVGVVEPWMSGIGGIGAMLVRSARDGKVTAIDFGARAPAGLDPSRYKVLPGHDIDLFGWPKVEGDRNIIGPMAVAVPAEPAGLWAAHKRFGARPWRDLVMPAAEAAREGLTVDGSVMGYITGACKDLAADPGCRERYLPGGYPPVPQVVVPSTKPLRLPAEALARTLTAMAEGGAAAYHEGPIGKRLAAAVQRGGGFLSERDIASVSPAIMDAQAVRYRNRTVHIVPGLNGGPTMTEALGHLEKAWRPAGEAPDGAAFAAYGDALQAAWRRRLAEMGDGSPHATSTTHLAAVDAEGNMVTLTQTLLSLFGARFLDPDTGILLNNGINWFDPRPGAANSIAPAKKVLANYCPAIVAGEDDLIGLGGCGGRKILPAVLNLVSFMVDYRMSLDAAMHAPRIDVSGPDALVADRRLPQDALAVMAERHEVLLADRASYPSSFTIASAVRRRGGRNEGATEPWHPTAEAVAE